MKKYKLKLLCSILIFATTLAFSGCNKINENEKSEEPSVVVNPDKNQTSVNSEDKTKDEVVKKPSASAKELEFKAIYERSPHYDSSKKYPIITICKSKKDLNEHEGKVKGLTVSMLSYTSENNDTDISKYDDKFFTKKALIAITLDESSGSVRHNVKKVVKDGNEIMVAIERKIPELGTADMAEWNIYVELNTEDVDKNDTVNLGFNGGLN